MLIVNKMDVSAILFVFIFLVTQGVQMNPTVVPDEAVDTSTPAAAEMNTVNTIDVLQNQLNQILVQFCASEIDRNKTASAILKFGQLANQKASIEDVVEFYVDNYEESFDNLLHFINHIASFELQQMAYNTLVEGMQSNQINVINLLSFENFIRTRFELLDDDHKRTFYEVLMLKLGRNIKELIVSTDLNKVLTFINTTNNPDRIFELIPTIVRGIDLNNFTDMDRIFEFSMQLPRVNQIKLIGKVLSEMNEKRQYRHVLHVIIQIKKLRRNADSLRNWTEEDKCLLSRLENDIPADLEELLSEGSRWQMEFYSPENFGSKSIFSSDNLLLFASSHKEHQKWYFVDRSFNSVSIGSSYNNRYLSVSYCFHNDSYPTVRNSDESDRTQNSWYLLMSDDLSNFQLKNIYTNELLVIEDTTMLPKHQTDIRVKLSKSFLDSDDSKWSLELKNGGYSRSNSNCNEYNNEN